MKTSPQSEPAMCPPMMAAVFLGLLVFFMGVALLLNYQDSVNWIMNEMLGISLGRLDVVVGYVTQVVAYSWPFAAVLIGISFVTGFWRCYAATLFLVYLLTFALGHVWTDNMSAATFDLVMALFVVKMKGMWV